jgi:hypothetical protein
VEKPQEAQSENHSDILRNIDNSNKVSRNVALEDDGGGNFPPEDDLLPCNEDDNDARIAAAPPLNDVL